MATIVANFFTGFNMTTFDLSFMPAMTLTDIRTTNLGWSSSGNPVALSFYGFDFAVTESGSHVLTVTAGTIFTVGLDYTEGALRFSGSFDAVHVASLMESENIGGFNRLMLGGDDQVTGGLFNDVLLGGAGNDALMGGMGDDGLRGGSGSDTLIGGPGNDTLMGGGGADYFLFETAPGIGNVDRIADLTPGTDHIALSLADFAVFVGTGNINPLAFHEGRLARTADQHLIYNPVNGNLFFDVDGKGGSPQVLIAHLDHGLSLTSSDFYILL